MGRVQRVDVGGEFYHVLNRANARTPIFRKEKDFEAFENIIEEAQEKYSMQILAYCLMPNHWHFIVSPKNNGDLNLFMQWLTLTHTQRWHAHYHSAGYGHLYQGRYKSFLIQNDQYLLNACRYVESNAIRAKLKTRAEDWRWSSLWRKEKGSDKQKKFLSPWPIDVPEEYLTTVNKLQTEQELENIRECVKKGRPFGDDFWLSKTIKRFSLEMTLRNPGRPKNGT